MMKIASLYDKPLDCSHVKIVTLSVSGTIVTKLRILNLQNNGRIIANQHAIFIIDESAIAYCQFSTLESNPGAVLIRYPCAGKFYVFHDKVAVAYNPNSF